MPTFIPPKRATEFIFYVALASQAGAHAFQSNPTISVGDVKCSTDGGALANLATLPAVTPASSKLVKVTLSTSEMTADNVTVIFSDAAGDEWDDLVVNIQTSAQQLDDLATASKLLKYLQLTLREDAGIFFLNAAELDEINDGDGTYNNQVSSLGAFATAFNSLGILVNAARDKIRKYLQLLSRKDAAIATDNAVELAELNANGGSGAGAYVNTTDALEALADNAGGSAPTVDQIRAGVWGDTDVYAAGSKADELAQLVPGAALNLTFETTELHVSDS